MKGLKYRIFGMREAVTVGELSVNKAKYDALPTDLKKILTTTIQAAYWIHFVPFQEKTPKTCGELTASGVKVIKTTDELNNRGRRASRRAGPIPSVHLVGAASRQRLRT
jgi:TRAP-type mannitol/chloroaromatic compound transport system substrate-binding protein